MKPTLEQMKKIEEAEKRLSMGGGVLRDKYKDISWINAKKEKPITGRDV